MKPLIAYLVISPLLCLFIGFQWGVYDYEKSLDSKADYIVSNEKQTVWVKRK